MRLIKLIILIFLISTQHNIRAQVAIFTASIYNDTTWLQIYGDTLEIDSINGESFIICDGALEIIHPIDINRVYPPNKDSIDYWFDGTIRSEVYCFADISKSWGDTCIPMLLLYFPNTQINQILVRRSTSVNFNSVNDRIEQKIGHSVSNYEVHFFAISCTDKRTNVRYVICHIQLVPKLDIYSAMTFIGTFQNGFFRELIFVD